MVRRPAAEQKTRSVQTPSKPPNAAESAGYTHDMLMALAEIAARHNQSELVLLLNAAAAEAKSLARTEG
jgi:hypothetical protein